MWKKLIDELPEMYRDVYIKRTHLIDNQKILIGYLQETGYEINMREKIPIRDDYCWWIDVLRDTIDANPDDKWMYVEDLDKILGDNHE